MAVAILLDDGLGPHVLRLLIVAERMVAVEKSMDQSVGHDLTTRLNWPALFPVACDPIINHHQVTIVSTCPATDWASLSGSQNLRVALSTPSWPADRLEE